MRRVLITESPAERALSGGVQPGSRYEIRGVIRRTVSSSGRVGEGGARVGVVPTGRVPGAHQDDGGSRPQAPWDRTLTGRGHAPCEARNCQ